MSTDHPNPNDLHDGAWQAAAASGCDMLLLEESLAIPPSERLRLHDLAVRRLEELEVAMRKAGHGDGSPR